MSKHASSMPLIGAGDVVVVSTAADAPGSNVAGPNAKADTISIGATNFSALLPPLAR